MYLQTTVTKFVFIPITEFINEYEKYIFLKTMHNDVLITHILLHRRKSLFGILTVVLVPRDFFFFQPIQNEGNTRLNFDIHT